MRRFLICCVLSLLHIMAAPLSATEPVEAYAQLPGVLDAAISPDGKAIAAIVENNGKYDLAVFEFEENSIKPNATGLHKDVIPLWIKWANNDYILVSFQQNHSVGRRHTATGHMYTFNRDLSQSRELILEKSRAFVAGGRLNSGNRAKNKVIDFLPNDPEHILMSFSDDASNAPHVHKVNVATRKYSKVQHGLDYIDDWVTDLRGEVRVSKGRRTLDWSGVLKIRDQDSDNWRDVSEFPGLDADAKVFGFTENPNEMIVGHYNNQNTLGLYVYDLAKKRWGRKLFQNSDYDVAGIVLSPDGSKVIGAHYIVDDISVEFFDPTSKARMDKIRASMIGYSPYFLDQTQDGRYVLIKALSPDEPSKIILYDTQTNTPRVIGSDYPKLSGVQQGDVKAVRYTARDGTKIPAYVTLPHKVTNSGSLKDVPFIILPHGGPSARQTINFDSLAQFLANRGYGVLQMNFRGSKGYGREYEKAGRENWDVMQNDVEDGTRWLIDKGYADPERICIMGWSYGGYAALLAAARSSELYQCAISLAAITDLEAYLSHRVQRRYAKGNFYENSLSHFISAGLGKRANVRNNSPMLLADQINIPVLIAHGERDTVVGLHHFRRMEKALKKAGVQYTAVRLENSDHNLRDGAARVKFFRAMDEFLEQHLGKSEYAP